MLLRAALLASTAIANPALADDFLMPAPVSEVTVYPRGATVTRRITLELPAGNHRVLIPAIAGDLMNDPPRILSDNATRIGAVSLVANGVTNPEEIYLPEQIAAKAVLDAAEDALIAGQDELARLQSELSAAEARLSFLQSVSGGALDTLDPVKLAETAAMLGTQVSQARAEIDTARPAIRAQAEAVQDLTRALEQARQDFIALAPPSGPVDILAIAVERAEAGVATLEIGGLVPDASWQPSYEMRLTTGDNAKIDVTRQVILQQGSGEPWNNVAVTLSTADPYAQTDPSYIAPNLAEIGRTVVQPRSSVSFDSKVAGSARLAEPMMEAEVMADTAIAGFAQIAPDGATVTYSYPRPVNLASGAAALQLVLDEFSLEAETTLRAVPRQDKTAFLMAKARNTTGEPILPGVAALYRDGVFVGRVASADVPAGGEAELSFGPIDGIRLDWKRLDNDTGDTGIVSRSNRRQQQLEFSVENLTGEAADVMTLFALPYSEQEDLEVRAVARPAPDETDWEDRRNVGVWNLDLQPGQKKTVRVNVDLTWPTDQELYWRP